MSYHDAKTQCPIDIFFINDSSILTFVMMKELFSVCLLLKRIRQFFLFFFVKCLNLLGGYFIVPDENVIP